MDEEATSKKKKKSKGGEEPQKVQKGEKNHKKKEGNAPRDERIFEIIRHTQMMTVSSVGNFWHIF